mgnify:CR=1 FL=1
MNFLQNNQVLFVYTLKLKLLHLVENIFLIQRKLLVQLTYQNRRPFSKEGFGVNVMYKWKLNTEVTDPVY